MLRDGPFDTAERKGSQTGICPVWLLDAFFMSHTTFGEPCAELACKTCVAAGEDAGFGGEPWAPPAQPSDRGDWEIPF